MRHFGDARSDAIVHPVDIDFPRISKFQSDRRISDVLVAGKHIGQNTHIAGALNVILPANRPHADGRAAQIAGQQCQAGETFHHIDRLTKLRDAHSPHHRC